MASPAREWPFRILGAALWIASAAAAEPCGLAFRPGAPIVDFASAGDGPGAAGTPAEGLPLATGVELALRPDTAAAPASALGTAELLLGVLPCLMSILEDSRDGASDREAAAWIVASPRAGGLPVCLAWPQTDERATARWSGPLPRGLLAQVHSHPTRAASGRRSTPRPSRNDCATSRRLGIPVLTVSQAGVFECRPDDSRIVRHLPAGWERGPAGPLARIARRVTAAGCFPAIAVELAASGVLAPGIASE